MRRAPVAVALLAVLSVCGCGAPPPQAPLPYAAKLDSATGSISTTCGEAAQVTAFPGDHRTDLLTLEATAGSAARKLASVYHRDPNWIYQGDTIRQIVHDSLSMLGSCGLHRARALLAHSTGQ